MASSGKKVRRPWPKEDTERLLKLLARGRSHVQCARALGRSLRSIQTKLTFLGKTRICSMRGKRRFEILWSDRDDSTLSKLIQRYSVEQLCERLGRTRYAVWRRSSDLGLSKKTPPPWEYGDIVAVLRSAAPHSRVTLNHARTAKAVSVKRCRLRRLHMSGKLNDYIRTVPGAPLKKCHRFDDAYPPGLYCDWARLNRKAKDKIAREYLAREAERDRQRAARELWLVRCPKRPSR